MDIYVTNKSENIIALLAASIVGFVLWQILEIFLPMKAFAIIVAVAVTFALIFYGVIAARLSHLFSFFLLIMPFFSVCEFYFRGTKYSDIPFGPFILSPSIIFSLILFFIIFMRSLFDDKRAFKINIGLWVAVFIISLFISSILSINPARSLQDWLLNCAIFPMFLYITAVSAKKMSDLVLLYYSTIAFTLLRVVFSYGQLILSGQVPNILALYSYTDHFSRVIDHLSIISILVFFGYFLALGANKTVSPIMVAILILMFIVIVAIQDRAAMISFILANIMFLSVSTICLKNRTIFIYLVPMAGLCMLLSRSIFERFSGMDLASEVNLLMRIDAWFAAIRMFLDHPLFGVGLGMWDHYVPSYCRIYLSSYGYRLFTVYPHNFFLHYLTSGGIFTFLSLLAIYFLVFKRAFGNFHLPDDILRNMSLGIFCAIFSFFVYGLIGGNHSAFTFITGDQYGSITGRSIIAGMLFWTSVGLLYAADNIESDIKNDINR